MWISTVFAKTNYGLEQPEYSFRDSFHLKLGSSTESIKKLMDFCAWSFWLWIDFISPVLLISLRE